MSHHMLRGATLGVTFVALAVFAGCAANTSTSSDTSATVQEGTLNAEQQAALQTQVDAYIHAQWPNSTVKATVDEDGRVTMEGTVATKEEGEAMETGVESIQGVDRVRNRLDVQAEVSGEATTQGDVQGETQGGDSGEVSGEVSQ